MEVVVDLIQVVEKEINNIEKDISKRIRKIKEGAQQLDVEPFVVLKEASRKILEDELVETFTLSDIEEQLKQTARESLEPIIEILESILEKAED